MVRPGPNSYDAGSLRAPQPSIFKARSEVGALINLKAHLGLMVGQMVPLEQRYTKV
jgi:hypothetical protein